MRGLLNIETYRKIIWESEKDLNHSRQDIRPIRWFILLWVGIVSLWGSAQLFLGDYVRLPVGGFIFITSWVSWHSSLSSKRMLSIQSPEQPFLLLNHVPYPLEIVCVLLMALHLGIHWLCLSGKLQKRWYGPYFLLQGGCVLVISFIWPDTIIALGLYLVLVIEALSMLKQVQQIAEIVATLLVLFILTILWQLTQVAVWITLESVLLLVIFIIGWIILLIQQVRALSQLEAAHLQLAAYAMRVEELTLVNERQRLARELHDTLAQDLVGLTLQLERVDLHLEKQRFERARELVQQAMARARATLTEARSAIDDLRAQTLDPDDLLLALQREIDRFQASTSIKCTANLDALTTLPEPLCEHVLRMITEGLTNVARHSQAHSVQICAYQHEAILTIEVCDDGAGFESTEAASQRGHYGLLGLRERARLGGGCLDIASTVGKGTTLRLHLPLKAKGALE